MILAELRAVSWWDGAIAQISSIVNDTSLYNDNRIVGKNQNNARSGVEQPAHLTKVFKLLKPYPKRI